jgi:hypothetical protein
MQLARVFTQRCFHLFVAMLALVIVGPLASATPRGWIAVDVIESFVLVAAVAAFGSGGLSVVISLLLAVPMIGFQIYAGKVGLREYDGFDRVRCRVLRDIYAVPPSLGVPARGRDRRQALWRRRRVSHDRCALGVSLRPRRVLHTGRVFLRGSKQQLDATDSVYFSFTVLTSTGLGDIVPRAPIAQSLTVAKEIVGVLFVAILVARLAGIYPPREGRE